MRPGDQAGCGGTGVASTYFLLEPTNTNPKNNFPASKAFVASRRAATTCRTSRCCPGIPAPPKARRTTASPTRRRSRNPPSPVRRAGGAAGAAAPRPPSRRSRRAARPTAIKLIGYWAGYGGPGSTIPLREVSPQWDVIIVAFSTPDRNAPEGTMQFRTPAGLDTEQFKSDIAWLKSQGKKVMISLGGGGQHFTLADPKRVPNFVSSVTRIVTEYGFDGIDIDFESPSLSIDPGDTDFQHPTTPSIVNLISALRQLRDHFGPRFMISLVPEGTQIPSGYPELRRPVRLLPGDHACASATSSRSSTCRDYNTPPLQGLDGEIYQPGSVDYHAAMTELLLHGFNVGGDPKQFFPPMPADKVAVGFLTGDTTPAIVSQAMDYIITGKAPAGTTYKLREPAGYPGMIGAMFWTIDADRRGNYNFSNTSGRNFHGYPPAK